MNTLSSLLSFIGSFEPVGSVKMYAGVGSTPPKGWLFCQGQAVSRTDYPKLFSAIGVVYGAGDGSTTFNLPNFCGRTAIGAGSSGTTGAVNHPLGDQNGAETVLLSDQQMAHGHGMTQPAFTIAKEGMTSTGMSANQTHSHNDGSQSGVSGGLTSGYTTIATVADAANGTRSTTSANLAHTHKVPSAAYSVPRTTNAAVSPIYGASSTRTAHDNMPPYTTVRYIIFAGV